MRQSLRSGFRLIVSLLFVPLAYGEAPKCERNCIAVICQRVPSAMFFKGRFQAVFKRLCDPHEGDLARVVGHAYIGRGDVDTHRVDTDLLRGQKRLELLGAVAFRTSPSKVYDMLRLKSFFPQIFEISGAVQDQHVAYVATPVLNEATFTYRLNDKVDAYLEPTPDFQGKVRYFSLKQGETYAAYITMLQTFNEPIAHEGFLIIQKLDGSHHFESVVIVYGDFTFSSKDKKGVAAGKIYHQFRQDLVLYWRTQAVAKNAGIYFVD